MENIEIEIVKTVTKEQIEIVHSLFIEYSLELGFGLDFQNFEKELEELPGQYSEPEGVMLIAYEGSTAAGCVTLRKIEKDICEMKRLYVKPVFRAKGMGKLLSERIIEEARKKGYKLMRLDTVSGMKVAINIYQKLGFYEIGPYRYNPMEDAVYMELTL